MKETKILIAEDENIVALNIKNILERNGYRVTEVVYSGLEALKKVAETNPDLVLMDIRLKGDIDGIEAAGEIRLRFNIPIIYLTACTDNKTLRRANITEPFGYIIKPFQEKNLNATIELALYKGKVQNNLQKEKEWFATILESIGDSVVVTDDRGLVTFMNPLAESLTEWKKEEAFGKDVNEVLNIINTETQEFTGNPIRDAIQNGIVVRLAEHWILRTKNGTERFIGDSAAPIRDEAGNITGVVAIFQDITDRKRAEEALRQQTERERLITIITQRIRQSLNLEEILNTTVGEVREFLQTDRVFIYRFEPDWSGVIAVESVGSDWIPILGTKINDCYFAETYVEPYRNGRIQATDDIYTAGLTQCHIDLLAQLQVRSTLVVPILQGEELWGLLVANHCRAPRQWQPLEIDLLTSLATQLAIAIQQAELYKQTQQQAQREQALNRFTSAIRSTLELEVIFATAAAEISQLLHIDRVEILKYLPERQVWLTVADYRQRSGLMSCLGMEISDAGNPLGSRLKQLEVVRIDNSHTLEDEVNKGLAETFPGAWLLIPLHFQARLWGSLTLAMEGHSHQWQDSEVELACAIAAQLAIAIQQSELYQQVQRLNVDLEHQVQERTAQLQKALDFEAMLKFCELVPTLRGSLTILGCPIFDNEGVLGDIWLFKQRGDAFNDLEIRLVQQVANHCAIAIRQARLFQASLTQVEELERLDQLKNDFLSTVSHELRTPMSNIKMAMEMLGITLGQGRAISPEQALPEAQQTEAQQSRVNRYFQILHDECDREIGLLNDLLDVQHLDAGTPPLDLAVIPLQDWIPHIVESFIP